MELPSCKDLGGEENTAHGFCPVAYYVPQDTYGPEGSLDESYWAAGSWGFVAGCIWGDSSMKLEYLDLSKIEEGIIKREARFGYLELPRIPEEGLKKLIEIDDYRTLARVPGEFYDPGNPNYDICYFKIATEKRFTLKPTEDVISYQKDCKCHERHTKVWPET